MNKTLDVHCVLCHYHHRQPFFRHHNAIIAQIPDHHVTRYSETNRRRLYCSHTMFEPCLSPGIQLVINKRQKNIMECCQVNFIEGIKNFFIIHKAEELIIKPSGSIILASPQPFYTLIVSTFAAYHASMLWSSICNGKICNKYIFLFIWSHPTGNTVGFHAFQVWDLLFLTHSRELEFG